MDNLHVRLNLDPGKENKIYHHHSSKEHVKISRIAKFGWQMLKNTENIASRSLRILYIFILRTEKSYHFRSNFASKVVTFSMRKWIYTKFANFVRLYFPYFLTFANQILHFY